LSSHCPKAEVLELPPVDLITAHPRGVRNIVISMYVCFCLSVCLSLAYLRNQTAEFGHFLATTSDALALSSSDCVAICCVLPVLWMASSFSHSGLYTVRHRGECAAPETTASILTKFCSTIKIVKYTSYVAHRGRSLPSTIDSFIVCCFAEAASAFRRERDRCRDDGKSVVSGRHLKTRPAGGARASAPATLSTAVDLGTRPPLIDRSID